MQTVTTILTDAGPIAPSGPSDASQSSATESNFGDVLNQELNSQTNASKGDKKAAESANSQKPSDKSAATPDADSKDVDSSASLESGKSQKADAKASNTEKAKENEGNAVATESTVGQDKVPSESLPLDKATQLALLRRDAGEQNKSAVKEAALDTEPDETAKSNVASASPKKNQTNAYVNHTNVGEQNAEAKSNPKSTATKEVSASDTKAAEENASFLGMLKQAKQTKTTVQKNADDSAGGIDQRAGMVDAKQKGQIGDSTETAKAQFIGQQAQVIKQGDKGAGDNITPVISPEKNGEAETKTKAFDFAVPNKIKRAMDAAQAAKNAKPTTEDSDGDNVVNLSDRPLTKADVNPDSGNQQGVVTEKPFTLIQKQVASTGDNTTPVDGKALNDSAIKPSPVQAKDELSPIPVGDEISPIKDESGIESELFATSSVEKKQGDTQQVTEKVRTDIAQATSVTSTPAQTATVETESMMTAVEAPSVMAESASQHKASEQKSPSSQTVDTTESALKAQNSMAEAAAQHSGEQQGDQSQQKNQQQSEFAELLNQVEPNTGERKASGQDSSIAMSSQPSSASRVAATQNANALNQPNKAAADVEAQINETIHTSKANFAVAAHERVMLMSNNGVNFADIRLDPADLGKMQIKMSQDGDQVNVSFIVQQPHAKEALESALPKLKEMLAEQGIEMGEGAISQESPKREADKDGGSGGQGQYAGNAEEEIGESELDDMPANHIRIAGGALGGIDYFA